MPGLVGLFGAGPGASGAARSYLSVSLLGVPAMLVVLAATGVLRGLQDTRTPLVVAGAGFGTNAVLSFLLVHGPGPLPALGVAGSAVGDGGGADWGWRPGSSALVVAGARREGAPLSPHGAGIRAAAVAGVPLLLRTVTLRVALLATVWAAAGDGHGVARGAPGRLHGLDLRGLRARRAGHRRPGAHGPEPGRGDAVGTRAVTRRMVRWGVGGGAVLGGLLAAGSPWLPWLFSQDPQVRTGITVGLLVVGLTAPLAGYVFVLDGVLIGAGDGPYLARAGVLALLGYLPLLAVVPLAGLTGTTGLLVLWLAFARRLHGRPRPHPGAAGALRPLGRAGRLSRPSVPPAPGTDARGPSVADRAGRLQVPRVAASYEDPRGTDPTSAATPTRGAPSSPLAGRLGTGAAGVGWWSPRLAPSSSASPRWQGPTPCHVARLFGRPPPHDRYRVVERV